TTRSRADAPKSVTGLPPDLPAIAREMKQAQDGVVQLAPFTARHPGFDVRAGYDVAMRVDGRRRAEGFVPVGRKIGFTNASLLPHPPAVARMRRARSGSGARCTPPPSLGSTTRRGD